MFFDGWYDILRVMVVGVVTYAALILFLRVLGKRTLSKWNAFDFVVTIAIGSTLSSALLTSDVSLFEGTAAILLLACLQFAITWLSIRSKKFADLVKSPPEALLIDGVPQREALRRNRVVDAELFAAVRAAGYGSLSGIELVVLETDGSFSVISRENAGDLGAARDLSNIAAGGEK